MKMAGGGNRIGEVFERAPHAPLLLLLIDDNKLAAEIAQQQLGNRQVEPRDDRRAGYLQPPGRLGPNPGARSRTMLSTCQPCARQNSVQIRDCSSRFASSDRELILA
jgi:hypothetical protein